LPAPRAESAVALAVAVAPIVMMGVTGSGKSTIGALLAERLGVPFIDGDDLHPEANREKMRTGIPLDDDDRAPWLDRIGETIAEARRDGVDVVVACSALKRRYRDALRRKAGDLVIVHLQGERDVIASRLDARSHEFMPVTLLASQVDALEPLGDDEAHLVADVTLTPDAMVTSIVDRLAPFAKDAR